MNSKDNGFVMNNLLYLISISLLIIITAEFYILLKPNIIKNNQTMQTAQRNTIDTVKHSYKKRDVNWREKNKYLQESGAMTSSLLINEIEATFYSFSFEEGVIKDFAYKAIFKIKIKKDIIPFFLNENDLKVLKVVNDKNEKISVDKLKQGDKIVLKSTTDLIIDKYDMNTSTKEFLINKI